MGELCQSGKALLNGNTHHIERKWMSRKYSEEEVVWHEHDFVKGPAEKVDIQFVEAPRWFLTLSTLYRLQIWLILLN